jgi:hypothetical protein
MDVEPLVLLSLPLTIFNNDSPSSLQCLHSGTPIVGWIKVAYQTLNDVSFDELNMEAQYRPEPHDPQNTYAMRCYYS